MKGITKINKISKNKIRVSFKDYNSANNLIKINDFSDLKK